MKKRYEQMLLSDRIFSLLNWIVLSLWFLVVLYPLIFIVSCSFSSPLAVMRGSVWFFPVEPNLEGYKTVFTSKNIWNGYLNTIFYTSVGTTINVVMTLAAAYPLSRRDYKLRNIIMFLLTFTMIFSGGLIPTYLLIKDLGMINSRWALLIPNAMAVWNVIISRTYFQSTIPVELLEASQLDGCNNTKFIIKVVVPLSGPIVAVIALFYAVGHWNSFFDAIIYLRDSKMYPLQVILREILIQNQSDSAMTESLQSQEAKQFLSELIKYALIVVASAPVIAIYPFVQKYFVKGVMIGAIKG